VTLYLTDAEEEMDIEEPLLSDPDEPPPPRGLEPDPLLPQPAQPPQPAPPVSPQPALRQPPQPALRQPQQPALPLQPALRQPPQTAPPVSPQPALRQPPQPAPPVSPLKVQDKNLGYTLCFDNINFKTKARHQSRDKGNAMFNMVQAYAARDRVPSMHLDDTPPQPQTILDLPITTYLPTNTDKHQLQNEYISVVSRIVSSKMAALAGMTIPEIEHQYAKELKRKSCMVNMFFINMLIL
jgi:hypothetical protein